MIRPKSEQKRPIPVVDDEPTIRDLIGVALADRGYDVQPALNGAEALEIIRGTRPNVILLDMRMPVMDAWEFARAYRESPGPHVPIIVLTAARCAGTRAAESSTPKGRSTRPGPVA